MNWKKVSNIYLVGIKGVGMTMLAQFLQAKGFFISGSDVPEYFQTDKTLNRLKIKVKKGFSLLDMPEKIDLVIHSSAFSSQNNIELKYFKKNGFKIMSYAEALSSVFNSYFGIAVCGTHGKTTVSSCLGYVLKESGLSPNVLVGAYVKQFKGSTLVGDSKYFLAELDEYQNKLKYFKPRAVVLNDIDYDHPDYFKSQSSYYRVFADFIKKIPKSGFLVTNLENKNSINLLRYNQGKNIVYYIDQPLISPKKNIFKKVYQARNWKIKKTFQNFDLFRGEESLGNFKIKAPGRFSVSNALAVLASSLELGAKIDDLRHSLASFSGADRRFDVLGTYQGTTIIDDYAHHPSEIKAALEAARQRYPDKELITAFHPHTFSRTQFLLEDFSKSFSLADDLYLVEIYPSAREKQGKVSSLDLIKKIRQYNKVISKEQNLFYLANLLEAEKVLHKRLGKNKVLLLLGAGDIFRIAYQWLKI